MATILVVDDGADARELLAKTVAAGGHEPVCAANGWEGLLALDHQAVDLILLDLMMPGMDGRTFLRILRKDRRYGNVPVILVTAIKDGELLSGARALGADGCLFKSEYAPRGLLEAIERELAGPNSTVRPRGENKGQLNN